MLVDCVAHRCRSIHAHPDGAADKAVLEFTVEVEDGEAVVVLALPGEVAWGLRGVLVDMFVTEEEECDASGSEVDA